MFASFRSLVRGAGPAMARQDGCALVQRGYHNRNPTAFIGTPLAEPYKMQAETRVFKHYGILFGKYNARMTARLFYYDVSKYKGTKIPQEIKPRVLCEASSTEPHFMETLYSTKNRSAAYHMGRLIAKRAYECGVLQYTTLLKYALGRDLGVHSIKEMVRTLSMKTSPRMQAFARGYKEERKLLMGNTDMMGIKIVVDGDGKEEDDFEYWPTINGEPAGIQATRTNDSTDSKSGN